MAEVSDFIDENGKWKCIECGACCLSIQLFPELYKFHRGDGGCKHLKSNMRCRIYAKRPGVCRTDVNHPDTPDLVRAAACAAVKTQMDEEIEQGLRSRVGKKWRLPTCPSATTPKSTAGTS